jgi:chemotaxis protein histidine kinase CheA
VASEEEKQHGDGIGFAGLSSMVSDVDVLLTSPSKQQKEASSSSKQQSSQASRPAGQEQPKPTQQSSQASRPAGQEQPKPTQQSSQASRPAGQEQPKPTQQSSQASRPAGQEQPKPTQQSSQASRPAGQEQPKPTQQSSQASRPAGQEQPKPTQQSSQASRPAGQEQPKPTQQSSQASRPAGQEQPKSTQQSSQAAHLVSQEQPRPTTQAFQPPNQPYGDSSIGKYFLGIAAIIFALWFVNLANNGTTSRPASSSGNSSASSAAPTPAWQPPIEHLKVPAPAWQPPIEQPKTSSRPTEDKPSVGRTNMLSTAQIRYCLAEKIRIDAAETVINNYVDSDVDRFNGYVADYNSRCGESQYQQSAFEIAQKDVEPYRIQLQVDGRSRFDRPSAAVRSQTPAQTPQPVSPSPREYSGLDKVPPAQKPPPPVRPSPDTMVQAIQLRLNELGYDAGSADGLFGSKTRMAISEFQSEIGIPSDGVASSSLLARLNTAARISAPLRDRQSIQNAPGSQNTISHPEANYPNETTRNDKNYSRCIDGQYPELCDHSLLTRTEAVRVDAAERKANFEKCIDGRYPALCNHSLLTPTEALRVDAGEGKANFEKCIDGRYPALCNHTLLTRTEAERVDAAERKANLDKCIDGRYPALCDHARLSPQEALLVHEAERRAGRSY